MEIELTEQQVDYIKNNLYEFTCVGSEFFKISRFINCVYVLDNDGIFYVGATKNLKNRLITCQHHKYFNQGKTSIYLAYNKLHPTKIKEKEQEVLDDFKNLSFKLYNQINSGYVYSKRDNFKFKAHKNEFDFINVLNYYENYNIKSFYYENKNDYIDKITNTIGFSHHKSPLIFNELIYDENKTKKDFYSNINK